MTTPAMRIRQLVLTAGLVLCLVGLVSGDGLLGTPAALQAGDGPGSAVALVAPAGPAWVLWPVVYAGLVGYTVWQWLPGRGAQRRQRAAGWWVAAAAGLHGAWLLTASAGLLWLAAVLAVALALVLGALLRVLHAEPAGSRLERVLLDGTCGLLLGWVVVATIADVAGALETAGAGPPAALTEVLGVVALVLVLMVLASVLLRWGGQLAVGAGAAWALTWVAVGRLAGEPASTPVGTAALVAVAGVVLALLVGRRAAAR